MLNRDQEIQPFSVTASPAAVWSSCQFTAGPHRETNNFNWANAQVFGLWEEAEVPRENPRRTCKVQGIEPSTLWLRADSADQDVVMHRFPLNFRLKLTFPSGSFQRTAVFKYLLSQLPSSSAAVLLLTDVLARRQFQLQLLLPMGEIGFAAKLKHKTRRHIEQNVFQHYNKD